MRKLCWLILAGLVSWSAYSLKVNAVSVTNLPTIGAWPDGRDRINNTLTALSNQLTGTYSVDAVSASNVTVSGGFTTSAQTLTVTNTQTLTLFAGTLYLSNTDAATITNEVAAATTDGQICQIYNLGTNTIVFTDGSGKNLGALRSLGQADSILLRAVVTGSITSWVEIAHSDV